MLKTERNHRQPLKKKGMEVAARTKVIEAFDIVVNSFLVQKEYTPYFGP